MSCRAAWLFCGVLLISIGFGAPSGAQDLSAEPPAHVSYVEGAAVLERDGQPDTAPANMPLLAGDRLRTDRGRVEILFADGSTLHLDADTTVDVESDELVRLLEGRIRLSIPGPDPQVGDRPDRQVAYRIDAPAGSVYIEGPGEYRVSVLPHPEGAEVELAVLRGSAELVNDDGRTPLRAGQQAYARSNAAPSYASLFNSASWDEFDQWSESRRDQRFGVSTQYLPEEVRPYAATFDSTGDWRYDASYGYVWYPTVSVGWRPYNNGRWFSLRPYGWTWVGADRWDWPTHHYGRWGINAGAWFWIPGRSWAPAWVSWAYAPGYVSWCPLGWNNRAVVQIVTGRGSDPWRAWSAVPARHFGGRSNVRQVMAREFDVRAPHPFVTAQDAPAVRGFAVPRSSTPVRVAGTAPARRSGSPVYTNLDAGASRVGTAPSRTVVGARGTAAGPNRTAGSADRLSGPRAVPRGDAGADPITANAIRRGASGPRSAPTAGGKVAAAPSAGTGAIVRGYTMPSNAPAPSGVQRAPTPVPYSAGQVQGPVRSRAVPYGTSAGGAQGRAVPRENAASLPAPARVEPYAAERPNGVRSPAAGTYPQPRYGSESYGRPAPPERRPAEPAADNGARAVPRAQPRESAPPPESRPSGGVERRGPATQGAAGTQQGGHTRSSGRGR
jgi:uncharacterized protein DUF6600/FecR-like protein